MSLPRVCAAIMCLGLLGYFAYNLFVGDYGLESHARLKSQAQTLEGELKGLRAIRQRLERDVALMRANRLDPDMLDERARAILNFSHPDDIVIMNKPPATDATR